VERAAPVTKTHLSLPRRVARPLPAAFAGDDVRYSEALVEHFLERFTAPGDVVIDPFAGYGTTLEVAERMDRVAFGVELDGERVAWARSFLRAPERMLHGDSRRLAELPLPRCQLSISSPPYRTRSHHPQDPLAAYREAGAGYRAYLDGLRDIYDALRERLLPAATVVIEVSNLRTEHEVTPLAWDLAAEVSRVLPFRGEIVVGWDAPAHGFDHSYCLLFENR
jgi:tRNA G10  N-methylase Trm11